MKKWVFCWVLGIIVMTLTACGKGSGSTPTVTGVAAAGAPMVGTVKLKDSSTPPKEVSAAIAEDGSFSLDTSGLTAPFVLSATGSVGSTNYSLYSFASGSGVANINPLANLAVSLASGGLDPAAIYASPSSAILQTVATKLNASVTDIQTRLQSLLALYDAAKVNPITDSFTANHTKLDEVLDMISIDLSGGNVTIKNKTSNAVILSGPLSNSGSWSVDTSKIPVPPVRAVISPVYATVAVGKSVDFKASVLRSANQKVTWSVVESGGGTISDLGIYTAPAKEGTYHVKAVSEADATYPAMAVVKVVSGQMVSVAIDPTSATLAPGTTKTFTASITGTSNTEVAWSVTETNGGSISSSGIYTAPSTTGTYHVKATSVADSSKSATATVTVSSSSTNTPTTSGTFPVGTWDSGKWGSFTISKVVQTLGTEKYYSGSITFPTFGTINVSGNIVADATIMSDGQYLGITTVNTSGGNVTSYAFTADKDQLRTGSSGTYLWGNLTIVSTASNYSYSGKYAFYLK